jgi:hypothetical protein
MFTAAWLPNHYQLQILGYLPFELCVHKGHLSGNFLFAPVPNLE